MFAMCRNGNVEGGVKARNSSTHAGNCCIHGTVLAVFAVLCLLPLQFAGAQESVFQQPLIVGQDAVSSPFDLLGERLGLRLTSPLSVFNEQIIYIESRGRSSVTYRGPQCIEGICVPPFDLRAADMSGQEDSVLQAIVARLNAMFSDTGVAFTVESPESHQSYSTVFLGGDGKNFREAFGTERPLVSVAEGVDTGNINPSDVGFVFSDAIVPGFVDQEQLIARLSDGIAQVSARLLGYAPAPQTHEAGATRGGATALQSTVDAGLDVIALAAASYLQRYGSSKTETWYVASGDYYFEVDAMELWQDTYTEWRRNGSFIETDWTQFPFSIDPNYTAYCGSGTTTIEAKVFYSGGTYKETHTWKMINDTYALGDINGDGYVNVGDLQLLVAVWGRGPIYVGPADLNKDGYINVGDLQLLVANWGSSAN